MMQRRIPTSFSCAVRCRRTGLVALPQTTTANRTRTITTRTMFFKTMEQPQFYLNKERSLSSHYQYYHMINISRRPRGIEFLSHVKLFSTSSFNERYPNLNPKTGKTEGTTTGTIFSSADADVLEQQPQKDPAASKVRSYEPKPWFDTRRSLEVRINELLDVDTIHPADIVHPMMADLIKQCCLPKRGRSPMAGMQRGQEILFRCLVEKRRYQMTTDLKLFVPQKLFQILLFGWCKIAHREYVAQVRMKEILQLAIEEGKMDDAFLHTKLKIPRTARIASEVYPTVYLFNTYLIGLGNAARMTPQAALDSEAILYDMIEYNRTMGWHTKPNTRSYTHVIVAYANTEHTAAGRRAYNILQQMKHVHDAEKDAYEERYQQPYNYFNPKENKHQIVTLDAAVYTATLKALQVSNRSPELVMDLLNEAVQAPGVVLDAMLFVTTIKSLSGIIDHEGNALVRIQLAQEAESILRTMIQYGTTTGFQRLPINKHEVIYELEHEVEESSHNLLFNTDNSEGTNTESSIIYSATEDVNTDDALQQTSMSNNNDDNDQKQMTNDAVTEPLPPNNNDKSTIDDNEDADGPQQSQNMDENMKSLQIGYNACIYAWAQSHCMEGAIQCERLLQEMLDSSHVQPNTTTFNTCYLAWSKSHKFHKDAGKRAIELLNRQFQLSAPDQLGDDVKPDFQTFTTCIHVQSKSSAEDRLILASALLNKLLDEIKLGNLSVTRNPTGPFSAVLTTIANFKVPKTTETVAVDDTMEDGSSEIDVFNSAVDTQSDPYSMALSIFDQIERDAHGIGTKVDHHCITAFFKCMVAHSIPGSMEREHTSRRVFEDACQNGQVSRPVLIEFQNLLGPAANTFPDLRNPPKPWSRNVNATFR